MRFGRCFDSLNNARVRLRAVLAAGALVGGCIAALARERFPRAGVVAAWLVLDVLGVPAFEQFDGAPAFLVNESGDGQGRQGQGDVRRRRSSFGR